MPMPTIGGKTRPTTSGGVSTKPDAALENRSDRDASVSQENDPGATRQKGTKTG